MSESGRFDKTKALRIVTVGNRQKAVHSFSTRSAAMAQDSLCAGEGVHTRLVDRESSGCNAAGRLGV
jgi:hypothetical protein